MALFSIVRHPLIRTLWYILTHSAAHPWSDETTERAEVSGRRQSPLRVNPEQAPAFMLGRVEGLTESS